MATERSVGKSFTLKKILTASGKPLYIYIQRSEIDGGSDVIGNVKIRASGAGVYGKPTGRTISPAKGSRKKSKFPVKLSLQGALDFEEWRYPHRQQGHRRRVYSSQEDE